MSLQFCRKMTPALVLFFLLCGVSSADELHYNNFLIGDRASGMGGAYAAVSDDPTGLYYNPAGIVYSTGKNLSASVNAYYNLNKKYDNVIGGNGWERNSSSLLPNFFGITQPLGSFQFGFSYAVPDSIQENQSQTFAGSIPTTLGSPANRYIINFNNQDATYLFGPSLAKEINSKLAIGATLYLHHRSNLSILNQHITLEDGRYEWSNQHIELVERGYKPLVGIMWTPVEKVTIGLAASKTFLYSASKTDQSISKSATATSVNDVDVVVSGTDEKRKYPYELKAGIAYFASSSLLVTVDGSFHPAITDANFGDRVRVYNGAIGAEYYVNKNWAVRAGYFTNMANTPDVQYGRINQDEKIDYHGVSASISNFTRNTSITFGGNMSKGSGDAQLIGNSSSIQHVSSVGWTIFLSSSYSY